MIEEINISSCFVSEWKNDKELYDYCRDYVKDIPWRTPGVYYIYEESELLYVGCSINIQDRLVDHLTRSCHSEGYINNATRIKYCVIEDKDMRELFEYNQIKELEPSKNKILPRLTKKQKEMIRMSKC